jgi:hypothetical protein
LHGNQHDHDAFYVDDADDFCSYVFLYKAFQCPRLPKHILWLQNETDDQRIPAFVLRFIRLLSAPHCLAHAQIRPG